MFIIFGWNHQTNKNYGPTREIICPNCGNKTYLNLLQTKTWFTLFFIPIFPYNSKHFLICKVCSRGIELSGEQIEKAMKLNSATGLYLKQTLSQEQYMKALSDSNL
jgi:hypothetical protein